MRWEVLLDVDTAERTFRNTFYKFIKEIISTNPALYEKYYRRERRKPKPFTFLAVIPPSEQRFEEGDTIAFLSPVKLYFSTSSPDLASTFEEFMERKLWESQIDPVILENRWTGRPTTLRVLRVREISSVPKGDISGIKVRFPALIVPHKQYSTLEEYFEKIGLYFEPTRPPRVYHTKHRIKDVGVVYRTYDIEGHFYPKTKESEIKLRDILHTGLGWRRSQGFGYPLIFREVKKKEVEIEHEQKPVVEK